MGRCVEQGLGGGSGGWGLATGASRCRECRPHIRVASRSPVRGAVPINAEPSQLKHQLPGHQEPN